MTAPLPGRLSARVLQIGLLAMREFDEHDPKAPRPVATPKKHSNPSEAAEHQPWRVRKDEDRDRHRHV